LEDYLKSRGIRHETSTPYTPAQNGIAERAIRTISEKARCLLLQAKLSKGYWGEAVNTATYLYNRTYVRSLGKAPFETIYGLKPSYFHIRIFGCICYAKNNSGDNKQFDPKSIKCRFLGYSESQKAYRLIEMGNKKIVISRDVIFNEEAFSADNDSHAPDQTMNVLKIVEGAANEDKVEEINEKNAAALRIAFQFRPTMTMK